MEMKKNKEYIIKELINKTNIDESKCIILNDILENNVIIGKNNKNKIIKDFIDKLEISAKEADNLYNICIEIILKGIIK